MLIVVNAGIRDDFLAALEAVSEQLKQRERDTVLKAARQDVMMDEGEFAYLRKTEKRFLELLVIKKLQDITKKSEEFHQKPGNAKI